MAPATGHHRKHDVFGARAAPYSGSSSLKRRFQPPRCTTTAERVCKTITERGWDFFSFSCCKSLRGKGLQSFTGHIGRRNQTRKQGPFTVARSWLEGVTPWLNRGLGWKQWHRSGIHPTGEALTALSIPFPVHNNQQHNLSKVIIPGHGWIGFSITAKPPPASDLGPWFYLGHTTQPGRTVQCYRY